MSDVAFSTSFTDDNLEQLIDAQDEPTWFAERRREAWRRFGETEWPSRRDEDWARTDLRGFHLDRYRVELDPASSTHVPEGLLSRGIAESGQALAGSITTLNGHVQDNSLQQSLADRGVLFAPMGDFLRDHPDLIRDRIMSGAFNIEQDRFAALHAAWCNGGSVLYVPRGVTVADPFYLMTALADGCADLSHLLVIMEDGAEATVVSEYLSTDETADSLHCGGVEILMGPRSNLRFVNLQDWSHKTWHFAQQKAVLDRDASLQWTIGAMGARLAKVNQEVALVGEGANCQVNGTMFTDGKQHLSYSTLQHHVAPNCRSDFLYKAALQDRSRTVWRGMILVDTDAQKTDGYQRNDNLLLSDRARADSIPGLEIEADDVRCTHGSTSGRVDEELIFYAQARGFTRHEAIRAVVTGFFQQIFDRITVESVRDALGEAIARRVRHYE